MLQGAPEDLSTLVLLRWFWCFALHTLISLYFFLYLPSFTLINQWWNLSDGDGRLTGADATKFFSLSNIPRQDLKQVTIYAVAFLCFLLILHAGIGSLWFFWLLSDYFLKHLLMYVPTFILGVFEAPCVCFVIYRTNDGLNCNVIYFDYCAHIRSCWAICVSLSWFGCPILCLILLIMNLCFFRFDKVWAIADTKRQGFLGFKEFVTAMQVRIRSHLLFHPFCKNYCYFDPDLSLQFAT